MIPIHLKHPDNLHSRFAGIDGSMRLLKTKMGIDWIFPKSCISENPVLVQTSVLAISPIDDNLFWDTSNHGRNQIPVLIVTQMGLHFLEPSVPSVDTMKQDFVGMIPVCSIDQNMIWILNLQFGEGAEAARFMFELGAHGQDTLG